MSQNINQVFQSNPITSNVSTDLMYFGQSPYGVGNDAAMTYSNFSTQFTLKVQTTKGDLIGYSTLPVRVGVGADGTLLQAASSQASGLQWTTATYPTTTSINQILYSSSANVVGGISTLDNGVLITGSTGIPQMLANSGTPGFVFTANSGAPPSWQSISASGAITTINGDSGSVTPTAGAITVSGGITGLTTSGSSSTLNVTGTLNLGHGGTSANLTASAGAIPYSTASALALSAVGSSGQLFQSTGTTAPSWTTATYPTTTTIDQILYSSANNVVSGLSTTNNGTLITNASGIPSIIGLTNGQLIIGSSSGAPTAATLTQGTGITITNGTNAITIAINGATPVVDETGSSVTMTSNTFYISDDGATMVTFTLPTSSAVGDWLEISGKGAGLWKIAQSAGQQIFISPSNTTSGTGGSLASVNQYDCVILRCITANTIWSVMSQQSTGLTVV